ncbi:hypothetical protein IDH21_05525 [Pelagibacterales bacterium SAG-MED47]|nr:hypothetical protein [Pelagibacterales bacterium SAG-MED47]
MNSIDKVKSISVWIFIIPFVSVNTCLLIVTNFHQILEPGVPIFPTFPYFDGGVSISRTVRDYPLYLIFKPAMFITSYLLIRYWLNTEKIIIYFKKDYTQTKKIIFFGVGSAILLAVHSIFLGIKLDNDLYKLFRRVVMLSFIIFELIAQAYLIKFFYDIKEKLDNYINSIYLKMKRILITFLIIISVITLPFLPFDNFKFLKHSIEWNVFLGVILFYLLTHLMWRKKTTF